MSPDVGDWLRRHSPTRLVGGHADDEPADVGAAMGGPPGNEPIVHEGMGGPGGGEPSAYAGDDPPMPQGADGGNEP